VHDAYNKFVDFYDENTKGPEFNGTKQTGAAGPMLGDFALNSVMFDLKRAFTNQVSGMPSNLNDFGDVGLTIGDLFSPSANRSKTTFSEDKLLAALRDDPSGVEKLFTQKQSGLADKMEKLFLSLTNGPGSTMASTIALQNQKIQDVQKRVTEYQQRVERKRLDLLTVFTNMEKSMSQIQSQGNSLITTLNQQMGALSGTNPK
jgi:flagellar hook-associated protein 2